MKLGASIYWILSEEKANRKILLETFPKKNVMSTKVGMRRIDHKVDPTRS